MAAHPRPTSRTQGGGTGIAPGSPDPLVPVLPAWNPPGTGETETDVETGESQTGGKETGVSQAGEMEGEKMETGGRDQGTVDPHLQAKDP